MSTVIKRVTEFDSNLVRELFAKAGENENTPNPGFFDDKNSIFLVSYTEGALSGFLWAYVLISPHRLQPEMFLYSIDVFGDFRRQGIATGLIEELKSIARMHNCSEMFVPTSKSNIAAVALYRRTGGKNVNDDDVTFTYDEDTLRS